MMLIVVPPKGVDLLLRVLQRREPMHVHTFFAEAPVERLDGGVVGRLAAAAEIGGRRRAGRRRSPCSKCHCVPSPVFAAPGGPLSHAATAACAAMPRVPRCTGDRSALSRHSSPRAASARADDGSRNGRASGRAPASAAGASERVLPAHVVHRRSRRPDHVARPTRAHAVSARHALHDLMLFDGLQNVLCSTSWSMTLSSDRSATSRFSVVFSSRSCVSSRHFVYFRSARRQSPHLNRREAIVRTSRCGAA